MIEHWPRWIKASIAKHFNTSVSGLGFYLDGDLRQKDETKDRIEVRVDGPYITQFTKNEFKVFVEINILVTTVNTEGNVYNCEINVGKVVKAFTSCIPVYRYGTGSDDNQEKLEDLILVTGQKEIIQVSNFGIIQATNPVQQSTVEGHYKMYLEGDA